MAIAITVPDRSLNTSWLTTRIGLWAACYLVLDTLVLAVGGAAVLLRRFGAGHVAAGAIATVLALAWLTWPVWLAPAP